MDALLWALTPTPIVPLWLVSSFMLGTAVSGLYYLWRLRQFIKEIRAEHHRSLDAVEKEFVRNLDELERGMVLRYGTPPDQYTHAPN